ncbi:DNA-binding protein [Streptococcus pyogenes]|nr:putative sigma factor [Streptococcus pyogenes]VGQ69524.1 putative sigma factor [Streptococcus pyogenes]VGV04597.1 DNA-binding protein [Streptococcus pyogenes]VGV49013.1 DNA-binding protein [Streptococcus pyogenes]VHB26642.1 DNA-binding protein [Streptococcus pyogenes]
MQKEYYLYVNGQKVKVSEQIYKVYWREKEHEKYLEQVDKKNHLLFFSSLDHDGHFVDNIIDESVDVEKIVETQMMIEALRNAISKLNDEERDIIERLYFNDETVRAVAKLKDITHPALIKRRNKILEKLKKFKTLVTKGVNLSLCKVKGSLISFTFVR